MIQTTVSCIKANQVLTKEKTGVPGAEFFKDFEGKLWLWTSLLLHQPCSSYPSFYRYYSFNSGLDDSVSFKRGTLSRGDLLRVAHELGSLWMMLGRVLNVPDAVIDQIEADTVKVSEKCYRKCSCVVCVVIMG